MTETESETKKIYSHVEEIPLHKDLKIGHIHQLTYFLLPNSRPKDTVELRLLINVGSLMEEDHEQGLAHFIEHLGFKGTKSYHGYELVKALQSFGITYGADLNASTHLLDTIYRLSLQMDDDLSQVKLGLNILKEWAFDMNISETDVQEEKNVISSEYLAKQGLGQRLLKKYWSKLFETGDSLLAKRMPIGIPEVFMNTPSPQIREFYEKWYKPENMAILVVGDFFGRENEIEEVLLSCFSGSDLTEVPAECSMLPLSTNILHLRSNYLQFPHHKEDIVVCMQDRELTVPQFSFEFFSETQNSNSPFFIRENIKHRLMTSLLDRRYAELVHKEKLPNDSLTALGEQRIPFQSLGMSIRELVRGLTCIGVSATLQLCDESMVEEKEQVVSHLNPAFEIAIRLLLLEFRRLRLYGVDVRELEDAKQKWSYLFKDQRDHQTTTSSTLSSDLTTHIFSGGQTVFATPQEEANLSLRIMNEITVEEMNQFLTAVLDMDLPEKDSHYYEASTCSSFRVLSAQTPQKLSLEYDSDVALKLALSRARDYVSSIEVVDPWPTSDVATEADVIAAAQIVVDQFRSKTDETLMSSSKIHFDEERKVAHEEVNFKYTPLCSCCKQEYCMFISPPVAKPTSLKVPAASLSNVNRISLDNIGAYELTLRNGIKICVKQMPEGSESPGRISLQAFALGGCTELNEVEDAVFSMLDSMCGQSTLYVGPTDRSSTLLPVVGMHFGEGDCGDSYKETESGLGNSFQILSGKKINHIQSVAKTRVNTQRHLNFRGIGGSCQSEKFELLLSLLVLKLTCQQIDEQSFEKILNQQKSGLTYRDNSPEFTFMERARVLSCGDIPQTRPLTMEVLERATLEMARTLYAKAFLSDPTEFTFVFVGDIPPLDQLSSLLDYYLGSLAPCGRSEMDIGRWRNASTLSSPLPFTCVGTDFSITHRQTESVHLRQDDKASSLMVFRANTRDYQGESEWIEEETDLFNILSLDIACRSLQSALLDSLRIDLGKVYSVSSDWSRGSLSPLALISIGLHCHPGDLAQITSEIERCIQSHREHGPNPDIVKGATEALITKQKNALKCPSHWLFWLLDSYKSYKVHQWKERSRPSLVDSSKWVSHFAYLRSEGKLNLISKTMTTENLTEIYQRYFDISKSVHVLLCPSATNETSPLHPLAAGDTSDQGSEEEREEVS
jgi:predicted Zn-dependent peptidase